MRPEDKRLLETLLMAHGFASIKDPAVIPFFAQSIEKFQGDKHWFYRGLISECEPAKRRDMYESLRPHFTEFKPYPLASYESQIAEEASRMVSHGVMRVEGSRPDAVQIGDHKYVGVPDEFAKEFAIRLCCKKCGRYGSFVAETAVDAMQKARKKGWVRDHIDLKEICHKCPAVRAKVGHA